MVSKIEKTHPTRSDLNKSFSNNWRLQSLNQILEDIFKKFYYDIYMLFEGNATVHYHHIIIIRNIHHLCKHTWYWMSQIDNVKVRQIIK